MFYFGYSTAVRPMTGAEEFKLQTNFGYRSVINTLFAPDFVAMGSYSGNPHARFRLIEQGDCTARHSAPGSSRPNARLEQPRSLLATCSTKQLIKVKFRYQLCQCVIPFAMLWNTMLWNTFWCAFDRQKLSCERKRVHRL